MYTSRRKVRGVLLYAFRASEEKLSPYCFLFLAYSMYVTLQVSVLVSHCTRFGPFSDPIAVMHTFYIIMHVAGVYVPSMPFPSSLKRLACY